MTLNNISLIIVFFCTLTASYSQIAKDVMPLKQIVHKTTETIIIDGKANETSWKKASWSNDFIDIQGDKTPNHQTNVKMLWDENYYYILAKIEDPHVWGDRKSVV